MDRRSATAGVIVGLDQLFLTYGWIREQLRGLINRSRRLLATNEWMCVERRPSGEDCGEDVYSGVANTS
jgi:hypothetical protein